MTEILICWLEADDQTVVTSLHLPSSATKCNKSLWDLIIGSPSKLAQTMIILTAVFLVFFPDECQDIP
jgi:hypothetical protein